MAFALCVHYCSPIYQGYCLQLDRTEPISLVRQTGKLLDAQGTVEVEIFILTSAKQK